jgi:hypothetical protein
VVGVRAGVAGRDRNLGLTREIETDEPDSVPGRRRTEFDVASAAGVEADPIEGDDAG